MSASARPCGRDGPRAAGVGRHAGRHGEHARVVGVEDGLAARRERGDEVALDAGDVLDRPHRLQVRRPDGRDDGDVGRGEGRQVRDVVRVARAHLEHEHAVVRPELVVDDEADAPRRVEAARRGERVEALPEDLGDGELDARLAIRARDGDDRQVGPGGEGGAGLPLEAGLHARLGRAHQPPRERRPDGRADVGREPAGEEGGHAVQGSRPPHADQDGQGGEPEREPCLPPQAVREDERLLLARPLDMRGRRERDHPARARRHAGRDGQPDGPDGGERDQARHRPSGSARRCGRPRASAATRRTRWACSLRAGRRAGSGAAAATRATRRRPRRERRRRRGRSQWERRAGESQQERHGSASGHPQGHRVPCPRPAPHPGRHARNEVTAAAYVP